MSDDYDEYEDWDDINEGRLFYKKYKVINKIGEGTFGHIYSAEHIKNNEVIALKIENQKNKIRLLKKESIILTYLKGRRGIPFVRSYGYSGPWNVLVMELLGKTINDFHVKCNGKFSLKTSIMIGLQIIDRLEYIHNRHIIHRDIKPENFLFGREGKANILYIIDFGLAEKYRSTKTLQHNPFKTGKQATGTPRYASINALAGNSQSRRDDLESFAYLLMYLLRGNLPWQGLKIRTKQDKYQKIIELKKETLVEDLCKGFPSQLAEFVTHIKGLGYTDDPNYDYLNELLMSIVKEQKIEIDNQWDWVNVDSIKQDNEREGEEIQETIVKTDEDKEK